MEIRMNKIKKGEHGYIRYRKKVQFIKSLTMFLVAAAIFILGLALNKWEKTNIFTILAVLCVLPAAKQLVGFIIIAPYTSVPDEIYQRIEGQLSRKECLYTDVVFTSPDKVMNLDFLTVVGNQVYGLIRKEKVKKDYMEKYLIESFKKQGLPVKVTILKDENKFIQRVNQGNVIALKEEEEKALTNLLLSFMV